MPRAVPWAAALLLTLAPCALAQTPPGQAGGALTSPEIKASQQPEPTEQGNRPIKPQSPETAAPDLRSALNEVYKAPPSLFSGEPIPRPNEWASNPESMTEPTRSADPSALTPEVR